MRSFLQAKRPLITALISAKEPDAILSEIALAKAEGADAFGIQIEQLAAEYRTEAVLKRIFDAMGDLPIYVCCYKIGDAIEETDEERTETILRALRAGGTMADIRMDLYDPTPYERTDNPEAVEKQIKIIKTIHEMGKEVLMSSHVWQDFEFLFLTKEEVAARANEQARRGADMAKIVAKADTEDELVEAFETLAFVAREVPIPTLFLVNGARALSHRLGGALMKEPLVFAREDSTTDDTKTQQPITNFVRLFKNAGVTEEE